MKIIKKFVFYGLLIIITIYGIFRLEGYALMYMQVPEYKRDLDAWQISDESCFVNEDYQQFIYKYKINDSMQLISEGYVANNKVYAYHLLLVGNGYSEGFPYQMIYGYFGRDDVVAGSRQSGIEGYTDQELLDTYDDTVAIEKYIIDNDSYPQESNIEINGVISYEDYTQIFEQFDLDGYQVLSDEEMKQCTDELKANGSLNVSNEKIESRFR